MSRQAKYIGPLTHLKGKTAMLREATHGKVVAQFDDPKARLSNNPWPQEWNPEPHSQHGGWWSDSETPPFDALGYGWHVFNPGDFDDYQGPPW